MDKEDSLLVDLKEQYKDKDWFGDVGYDQFGRPVLYVKYECHETIWDIPDVFWGKQLLVHFLSSHTARADGFMDKPQEKRLTNGLTALVEQTTQGILKKANMTLSPKEFTDKAHEAAKNGADVGVGQMLDEIPGIDATLDELEQERQLELSVRALTDEIDRLERICGSNILQDIFYEIQDGKNAVTNLSAKFPEVRARMQKLYDKYGFDIIYEELDG